MNKNLSDRDWKIKRGILGFFIGLAVIVPGVSGASFALIFKLYDKILHATSNIVKDFKKSFFFLFPIIIGALLGLVSGFFSIKKLIELIPFSIICLFAGLIIGSTPSLKSETQEPLSKKNLLLIISGMVIPVLLSTLSIIMGNAGYSVSLKIDFFSIIIYVLVGILVSATQFIPGCSATASLMALGFFIPLMNALSLTYIKCNPSIIIVFVFLGMGFLAGILLISKSMDRLITKYRKNIYYLFIGLSVGSVISLFFNADMLIIYEGWSDGNASLLDFILGVILLILGVITSLSLIYSIQKKEAHNRLN